VFLIENSIIAMRRRRVEVRERFDGNITFKFNGHYLDSHEGFEPNPVKTK